MNNIKIDEWFEQAYFQQKYLEGYNLHIDEIYRNIVKKDWISKSLEYFDLIMEEKLKKNINLKLILSVSLKECDSKIISQLRNLSLIPIKYFTETPPGFYLDSVERLSLFTPKYHKLYTEVDIEADVITYLNKGYNGQGNYHYTFIEIVEL